jgi:uncharacterized protein
VRRLPLVIALALAGASSAPAAALAAEWEPGPERYAIAVTRDVAVEMPDGRTLRADIHVPADPETHRPAPGPFPVLVGQTPYGKSAAPAAGTSGGMSEYLVRRGYIGVVVDVAGTGGSEGTSQLFGEPEASDGSRIVEWAAGLPGSNGKVGLLGHSYLAIDQLFTAAKMGRSSPLKAIAPSSAAVDPYRDLFVSGGSVNMESSLGLIAAYFGTRTLTPLAERGATDPLDALRLMLEHGFAGIPFEFTTGMHVLLEGERRFDGPYWRQRAPRRVLRKVVRNRVPALMLGGQWDVFQRGVPLLYSGLQNAAAGRSVTRPMRPRQPVSPRYQLVTGPWDHGNMGAGIDVQRLHLRWFDQWLKGRDTGILETNRPLRVIEPGGASYRARAYPVEGMQPQRLYLGSGGELRATPPSDGSESTPIAYTVLSDPCTRGVTQQWSAGLVSGAFATLLGSDPCATEPPAPGGLPGEADFTTAPLARDMRLGGPIGLTLTATSTTPETQFVATLFDVAPDGSATELTGGALLGSLRAVDRSRSWPARPDGWLLPHHPLTRESQRPVPTGEPVRYAIEIRPAMLTVPAGHRLRLRISSGEFPHLVPPPTGLPRMLGGVYRVQHGGHRSSWLDLPRVGGPR